MKQNNPYFKVLKKYSSWAPLPNFLCLRALLSIEVHLIERLFDLSLLELLQIHTIVQCFSGFPKLAALLGRFRSLWCLWKRFWVEWFENNHGFPFFLVWKNCSIAYDVPIGFFPQQLWSIQTRLEVTEYIFLFPKNFPECTQVYRCSSWKKSSKMLMYVSSRHQISCVDTIPSLLFLGSFPVDHYLVSIGIDQT